MSSLPWKEPCTNVPVPQVWTLDIHVVDMPLFLLKATVFAAG